jgi:hypothetical protein
MILDRIIVFPTATSLVVTLAPFPTSAIPLAVTQVIITTLVLVINALLIVMFVPTGLLAPPVKLVTSMIVAVVAAWIVGRCPPPNVLLTAPLISVLKCKVGLGVRL